MKKQNEYKRNRLKRKLHKLFQWTFNIVYFSITASVPIYVFYYVFSLKGSIVYALALTFTFFIVMDICCSLSEDCIYKIYMYGKRRKENKIKEKEELERTKKQEIQKMEEVLVEVGNYNSEVEYAEKQYEEFKKYIESIKEKLPQNVSNNMKQIFEKMQDIINILKENSEQYYPIRHMFKAYFPEFIRITHKYVDIITTETDTDSTQNFLKLVVEFKEYLDSLIERIQDTDKVNFDVGLKALTKIIQAERKNGDKYAEK